MRTFFLFYILQYLFGSPWIALVVVGLVLYFAEARYSGRFFNPVRVVTAGSQIRELQHRLDLNPWDAAAHNDIGRILCRKKSFQKAVPHLEKAAKRMGDVAETNYFLGLALRGSGREEEGAERMLKAVGLDSRFGFGEPHVQLAEHFLKKGDTERAAQHARSSVEINTSNVRGWLLLGKSLQESGETARALEALNEAIDAYRALPSHLRMEARSAMLSARKLRRKLE